MKHIDREDFRVTIVIRPRALADLFPGLDGQVVSGDITLTITPRSLGDLGIGRVPDERMARDVPAAYQQRCDELLADLLEKRHVISGAVTCRETALCSHCGLLWEELTAKDAELHADLIEEPGDGPGLPLCCQKAQDEWRAEQAKPAPQPAVKWTPEERRQRLLIEIHTRSGRWGTSRVSHLYKEWGIESAKTRGRADLQALEAAGRLTMYRADDRRYYLPTSKDGAKEAERSATEPAPPVRPLDALDCALRSAFDQGEPCDGDGNLLPPDRPDPSPLCDCYSAENPALPHDPKCSTSGGAE